MSGPAQDVVSADELGAMARRVLAEQTKRRDPFQTDAATARRQVWATAAELGWFLLTLPVERDGLGQDFAVLSTLYLELGRALATVPLINAMLAADALVAAGGAQAGPLLGAIADGTAMLAVQVPGSPPVQGRREGAQLVIDGRIPAALFPADATHALVSAEIAGEAAVLLLPLSAGDGVATMRATWDRTREIAEIAFAGRRVDADAVIATGPAAERIGRSGRSHFDLAIACDSIGGADQILSETVDYSRTRRQFGREIGSFQAIKHRCADMKTWLEAARALTQEAVRRYAGGDVKTPLAPAAKLYASEVYRRIAADAVQIHGGIGFTWEHDCHLFLKRALLNEQLGGAPADYQDRLFEPFAALVGRPS